MTKTKTEPRNTLQLGKKMTPISVALVASVIAMKLMCDFEEKNYHYELNIIFPEQDATLDEPELNVTFPTGYGLYINVTREISDNWSRFLQELEDLSMRMLFAENSDENDQPDLDIDHPIWKRETPEYFEPLRELVQFPLLRAELDEANDQI